MNKKNIANIVTFLNLIFGLISIFSSLKNHFIWAGAALITAVIFDCLDGTIARKLKVESDFGAELDSLSDLVSFGVAPAVLLFIFYDVWWFAFLFLIFILSGAFRLARFNILKSKFKDFLGMPITVNGVVFPLIIFFNLKPIIGLILVLISTILMISKVKFKKVRL
ncbi:MAG: CDP-diacylglycerol--serine O-phosphatidyltransferase [Nanoarchaeota archaeon]|nr:CDP-diacylglycerol--serine O-phosphatidyltransferase [Nanoarchaeota archaeon]